MRVWSLAVLLFATAASGQGRPSSLDRDARIQTVEYSSGGLIRIPTAPGTTQTIMFASGERVRSIVLSVPDAYAIDVSGSGDGFTLKPVGAGALAILSVRTDRRSYELELAPDPKRAASIVRFSYDRAPKSALPPGPMASAESINWRLSGDVTLRPESIRDDGRKTYITWAGDRAMPAVFAVGPGGKEEMVEGYVRAGAFTIDRVHERLTFRIDKRSAKARRVAEQGSDRLD